MPGINEPPALLLAACLECAAEAGKERLPIRHVELLRRTGLSTPTVDASMRRLRDADLVERIAKPTGKAPAKNRVRLSRIREAIG